MAKSLNEVLRAPFLRAFPPTSTSETLVASRAPAPPVSWTRSHAVHAHALMIRSHAVQASSNAIETASDLPADSSSLISGLAVAAAPASTATSDSTLMGSPSGAKSESCGGVASVSPGGVIPTPWTGVNSESLGGASSVPKTARVSPPAPAPSVAQAALALALALRDADSSIPKENLVLDIATAFLAAGTTGHSTNTQLSTPTQAMTRAMDIDSRLKSLETRIERAIIESAASNEKLDIEQKRLADLLSDIKSQTKVRLATMREISKLHDEAIAQLCPGMDN